MKHLTIILFIVGLSACSVSQIQTGDSIPQQKRLIPRGYASISIYSDPGPTTFSTPSYPVRSLRNRIEGIVELEYTVGPDGTPRDIEVVKSIGEAFEKEAIAALRKMQYPVEAQGVTAKVAYEFMIDYEEY